jgi:adenylate cyclase
MATESRKLAAIMFTDMVGYSAMSQKNEDLALELLQLHREMVRESLKNFNGNEIKTIGDAFMVQFSSAIDAIKCAVNIQKNFKEYNEQNEEERNIYLRIGIHIGDVVQRDGDIYGDGVNISSRLEPLAEPGGICISEDVARLVQNKVDFDLEKMDPTRLKNIKLPMEIYQIRLYANPNAGPPKSDNNRLAVLPFQDLSPDKNSDYFSDGLTEEIIMHLSGIEELKVVSRTTIMHFKNSPEKLETIGRELEARYILEGSVRRYKDELRITAQLIDVSTDTHLWAETYRGNMEDIFDIQENVSKKIVKALRLKLTPAEAVALEKRSTINSQAFDMNLRAREFMNRRTKSYLLAATDLFKKVVEQDPRYAAGYAGLAETYILLYLEHENKSIWIEKAMAAALKALMYDPNSSEAYTAMGMSHFQQGSKGEALDSVNKAIELDPDNYFSHWILGRIYRLLNRDTEAVEQFNLVLSLNPDFHTAYGDLQMAYKTLGQEGNQKELIERALEFYPEYILRYPDDSRAITFFAFVLIDAKQNEKAKEQMERALDLSPNDTTMIYNAACFFAEIGDKENALISLKKAIENGYEWYDYIKLDPDLDSIREEPEYIELMKDK